MSDTPKRRPRRRFDDDFKAQTVRLVLDEGKSVDSVGRQFAGRVGMFLWVEDFDTENPICQIGNRCPNDLIFTANM